MPLPHLAASVHRFARLLSSLSEHRWARDGYADMRSSHIHVLRHLDAEGTRHTVLAQRAQITKQTMGRLVAELAANGYVTMVPDPTDQRAQRVQLTRRGQDFKTYLASTVADLEQAFAYTVGEERLASFTATLHDLLLLLEKRQAEVENENRKA